MPDRELTFIWLELEAERCRLANGGRGEASQPCDASITKTRKARLPDNLDYSADFTDSDDSITSVVELRDILPAHKFYKITPSPEDTPRPESPTLGSDTPDLIMTGHPANELLSTRKSTDGLQIALHPLPLLEISDHITRSYQRGYQGAIVGALLGQQNGRQVTIEHSFTVGVAKGDDGLYHTDPVSFATRLEQMKEVHKAPALDLVGWYTLVPKTGPVADCLPIHNEILERYNESAVLLGFHIQEVLNPAPGNPLPITIYESNLEAEDTAKDAQSDSGEDQHMKDAESAPKMVLRFRELAYSTETGEAEMIAMQFIREGVAHATRETDSKQKTTTTTDKKGKGKAPASSFSQPEQPPAQAGPQDQDANLTKAELEQISALQTKANAIKMMHSRIGLLIAYLERIDPSLAPSAAGAAPSDNGRLPLSARILRQIQALVTNIELVTPAQQDELEKEMLQETNDVKLVGMMKDMFATVSDLRDVGKKFAVVESNRAQKGRQQAESNGRLAELGGGSGGGQTSMSGVGDLLMH